MLQDPHRDPGYYSTSRMILECALCMALQGADVRSDPWAGKNPGGVLNPASALGLVLVERLKKADYELTLREVSPGGHASKKSH